VSARVVLIGTKGGPAVRPGGALPTSSLLEMDGQRIVVDCGIGVTAGLARAGVSPRDLDAIFITHLHSDHVLELGPLIHTAWTTGLNRKLRVYGPPGTGAYWQGFLASMAFDNAIRVADEGRMPLDSLIDLVEYSEGTVAEGVTALRVPHPPVSDCFALKFTGSHVVVFSADTAFFPPLAEFAKGADLLIHEAMLPEAVEALIARTGLGDKLRAHLHASHSTAEQAARIATMAGVKHLALNHLIPADDPAFNETHWQAAVAPHWHGRLTLGRDGLSINVE
jgi:ribonuclease BN (tRNA processing enzyme)